MTFKHGDRIVYNHQGLKAYHGTIVRVYGDDSFYEYGVQFDMGGPVQCFGPNDLESEVK